MLVPIRVMMPPLPPDVVVSQAMDVPARIVLHFQNVATLIASKSAIGSGIPRFRLYAVLFLFKYLCFKLHEFTAMNSLPDAPALF